MDAIVVGLDGLEPSLVRQWRSDLPTLGRLMENGSVGRIRSSDPPLSAPAWPWIFTGKQGGKHGCFGFTARQEDGYDRTPINYGDINAESVWEALDDSGLSCGVANVPLTYPPADLDNGYVISGWPVPNRVTVSNPPEILEDVTEETGESYQVHPFSMGPELGKKSDEEVLEDIADGLWHHKRAFEALVRRGDVDLFFCVFMATDVAGHYLGRNLDMLRALYVEQDRALGELLDTCPPDTDIIVTSDHGHAAKSEWNFHVNEWLREQGYLSVDHSTGLGLKGALRTVGITRDRLISAKQTLNIENAREQLPQPAYELLKRVVPHADERNEGFDPDRIDWSETVAYSPDQNVIYLNTSDTHPEGVVDPDRAPELRMEIAQELADLDHPDPDRDERLMTEIQRREEIFSGPSTGDAPDLVPIADDMHVTLQTGFTDGDTFIRDKWSEHRQHGTLLTAGESFADQTDVQDRHILDLFPLVMELLDAPIPDDIDGTVPSERLSYTPDPKRRAGTDESTPSREYSEAESEAVKEQLKGLGYLE